MSIISSTASFAKQTATIAAKAALVGGVIYTTAILGCIYLRRKEEIDAKNREFLERSWVCLTSLAVRLGQETWRLLISMAEIEVKKLELLQGSLSSLTLLAGKVVQTVYSLAETTLAWQKYVSTSLPYRLLKYAAIAELINHMYHIKFPRRNV